MFHGKLVSADQLSKDDVQAFAKYAKVYAREHYFPEKNATELVGQIGKIKNIYADDPVTLKRMRKVETDILLNEKISQSPLKDFDVSEIGTRLLNTMLESGKKNLKHASYQLKDATIEERNRRSMYLIMGIGLPFFSIPIVGAFFLIDLLSKFIPPLRLTGKSDPWIDPPSKPRTFEWTAQLLDKVAEWKVRPHSGLIQNVENKKEVLKRLHTFKNLHENDVDFQKFIKNNKGYENLFLLEGGERNKALIEFCDKYLKEHP